MKQDSDTYLLNHNYALGKLVSSLKIDTTKSYVSTEECLQRISNE
jgi:hypothetical protein